MANHVTGTRLVADVLHAGGVNYSFGAVRPDTVQLHELLDSVDTTSSEAASVLQAIGVWKSGRGLACVVASASASARPFLAAISTARQTRSAMVVVVIAQPSLGERRKAVDESTESLLRVVCKGYFAVQDGTTIPAVLLGAAKSAVNGTCHCLCTVLRGGVCWIQSCMRHQQGERWWNGGRWLAYATISSERPFRPALPSLAPVQCACYA